MLRLTVLALALAVGAASTLDAQFDEFKTRFNKKYASPQEEARRFDNFKAFASRVESLNAKNVAAGGDECFGITFVADHDDDEKTHARGRADHYDNRFRNYPIRAPPARDSASSPADVDWRGTATTAVKNQGQCGSCWAFSVTEQIESEYMLQTGSVPQNFAPQQVASCTAACDGCGGGDTTTAYDYLTGVTGLASDWYIPYVQGMTPSGECEEKSCTETCAAAGGDDLDKLSVDSFYIGPYAILSNFSYATDPKLCGEDALSCDDMDEGTLQANLANAPASICVNAGEWDAYTGGVLTSAACGNNGNLALDHCVQAVGFNTTAATPYWIVRNSWSTNWGEEGYIYLAMGDNTCGLCDEATVVDLAN